MKSLELESHGIFLPPNAGRRLRQILANGLILFDSCVDAVLEEMSLTTPPSTAARAFSLEYAEQIRRDDAVHYLEWLSKHSHIEYEALFKWVLEDQISDPRICPLAASLISSHTPAGLAEFGRRIEAILRSADCPPLTLLHYWAFLNHIFTICIRRAGLDPFRLEWAGRYDGRVRSWWNGLTPVVPREVSGPRRIGNNKARDKMKTYNFVSLVRKKYLWRPGATEVQP